MADRGFDRPRFITRQTGYRPLLSALMGLAVFAVALHGTNASAAEPKNFIPDSEKQIALVNTPLPGAFLARETAIAGATASARPTETVTPNANALKARDIVWGFTPTATKPPLTERRIFTPQDTLDALRTASPLAYCIVDYEVGRGRGIYLPWDPNSVGEEGELGIAQLHPQGELNEFLKSFDNPRNPYQSLEYLEWAINNGRLIYWPTRRFCVQFIPSNP